MTKAEHIKWRKKMERDCSRLAAKYAKDKDYRLASRWYASAEVHQAVAKALQGRS